MTTLDAAPAALYRDALAAQSELINRPPLGVPRNTAFGTVQVNISSTVERTPSMCPPAMLSVGQLFIFAIIAAFSDASLSDQLSGFGGPHRDPLDSLGGLTSMIYCSDLGE